jgi:OFA family oxalate/formate antiporter-like MFS transporter
MYAGSFVVPYYISSAFDITAAILALFVLRPIIRKRIAGEGAAEVTGAAIPAAAAGATR